MSGALLQVGAAAYTAAVHIASLWNRKAAAAVRDRKGLLPAIESALRADTRPRIWMHCASLGEWEQGRPVLKALHEALPGHATVVTFFSPSGYRGAAGEGADYYFYLPFDGGRRAEHFLRVVAPEAAVFIKYDLWPGYIKAAARRAVPLFLVCARFRKGVGLLRRGLAPLRGLLRHFSGIGVQDAQSVAALHIYGLQSGETGDSRYDRVAARAAESPRVPYRNPYPSGSRVVVAGSTWPADEALLRQYFALHSSAYLILVPHEVSEDHLTRIEASWPAETVRWSTWDGRITPRILLVDRVGFLFDLYRWATVAFVGGGFARTGIHNVLEPAAHGVPVVFGPNHTDYSEAAALVQTGGAVAVKNGAGLTSALNAWLSDSEARDAAARAASAMVERGCGAAHRTAAFILQRMRHTSAIPDTFTS